MKSLYSRARLLSSQLKTESLTNTGERIKESLNIVDVTLASEDGQQFKAHKSEQDKCGIAPAHKIFRR